MNNNDIRKIKNGGIIGHNDQRDDKERGEKWVVTIEMRTRESNELKRDPVRSDWSGSEIGGAVMK